MGVTRCPTPAPSSWPRSIAPSRQGGIGDRLVIGQWIAADSRWERTQRAYDLLVRGIAPDRASSGEEAAQYADARGETDEFIEPTLVGSDGRISERDSVICFNFRPDRMETAHQGAGRARALAGVRRNCRAGRGEARAGRNVGRRSPNMTSAGTIRFAPQRPDASLSNVVADNGGRQLHAG